MQKLLSGRRWCVLLAGVLSLAAADAQRQTENVLVVTLDGMRWQEVFGGAVLELIPSKDGAPRETSALAGRFWRPTAAARREALMPFLWSSIAARGQIFGDATRGSVARVTNGLRFSYPGYNELFAGFPDPRIDSNDKVANPNVTVLEWLNGLPNLRGKVAAFGSWDVLPFILNVARSGLEANIADKPFPQPRNDRERLLDDLAADLPRYWPDEPFDALTMHAALEYLQTRQPRVLYVMLGETDDWAHDGRYDLYLDAAFRADRFIRRLWETAQSIPQYRDKTALLVTTDHGRGATASDWTDHGKNVPAAEPIWIAVMGPATPALGPRESTAVTQSQVAATIAALLGEDFQTAQPKAAPSLPGVVTPQRK